MSLGEKSDGVAVSCQDPRAVRRSPLFAGTRVADAWVDRHINELIKIGQTFGSGVNRDIPCDQDIARFSAAVLVNVGKRCGLIVCRGRDRFDGSGHDD